MTLKQISLSMPENLFKASKDYTKELGYRNLQEFILELVRKKVMLDNIDRYKKIEQDSSLKVTVIPCGRFARVKNKKPIIGG